ncbi:glycoside hydrolase family 16 protein [Sphaerobolus stellatus SS14]|uniref:Glycoside hydrolase family 16 protein n=1 Tax=Sphaerobolus stellatus (strain SS14) TaxID=990650 RepID=A0A0C9U9Q7_SPHS4|nr:glycoside hydrolase family 16 protein [Sphaerobolus stellatus SS14]
MSFHTSAGCSFQANPVQTGKLGDGNCDAGMNAGACANVDANMNTFGSGANSVKGRVYTLDWSVRMWFFQRSNILGDITSESPNPSSWGTPLLI